ncbi:hypothetical protein [Bacillus cereus]
MYAGRANMQLVKRYCQHGFSGGFPTFHTRSTSLFNYHTITKFSAVEHKDIPEFELPNLLNDPENVKLWIKDMNIFSRDRFKAGGDYIGAVPTFEEGKNGNTTVLGGYFFKSYEADFKRVDVEEIRNLGIPYSVEVEEQFRAAHLYAVKNGYISGVPTFTEEDPVRVIAGILLFKNHFAHVTEVPEHFIRNYPFAFEGFNDTFLPRLVTAIERAVGSIENGNYLEDDVKNSISEEFTKNKTIISNIPPYPADCPPTVKGCSTGETIRINENQFPLGDVVDVDLARTFIHEMAHQAGYNHINHLNSFDDYLDCGCTGNIKDVPEAAIDYWTSIPLMAECCIDGHQTLRITD